MCRRNQLRQGRAAIPKKYSTVGSKFKKICMQNKLTLLNASVRHLGTDVNYIVLENIYKELQDKVDFRFPRTGGNGGGAGKTGPIE